MAVEAVHLSKIERMMMHKPAKYFLWLTLLLCSYWTTGQNTVGQQYGFSINIPGQWQSYHLKEGDKILYLFMSLDGQVNMKLKLFPLEDKVHIFDLVSHFEKDELPAGFECALIKDYSNANSIAGKMGIYYGYINGEAESISVFYFINKDKGCILSTTVPVDRQQEKEEVVLSILDSFKFLNR